MSKAMEFMEACRAGLMLQEPFLASLALHLELVEDPTCETAWVDGKRMGFNPPFVLALTPSEGRGLFAHEVMHCARLHHTRRGGRDPKGWNEACDYVINPDLLKAGFNLPKGGLNKAEYADLSEEEVYAAIQAEKAKEEKKDGKQGKPQQQADNGAQGGNDGQNKPQQGNGQPDGKGQAQGGAWGEVRDAAPAHDAAALTASENEWKQNVRQALSVARARGAGNLPGHLQGVDAVTAAPSIDWLQVLRAFIDQSSVKATSWSRPNKRYLGQGYILPGMVSDSLSHLVIVVDDSSSIDQKAFAALAAEARAALEEGAADRVTVVYCNTAVHRVETFERGDVMELTTRGSGGTKFAPAFAWVEEHAPDASAVVYLTDLDSRDYGPEPSAPVLWAAYGSMAEIKRHAAHVPFGEIVPIAA